MNVVSTNLLTGTELILKPGHDMTRTQELYDCIEMCESMLESLKKDLEWEHKLEMINKYGIPPILADE